MVTAEKKSKTTSVSFRIDRNLKEEADELFQYLGLNMTTAFNMFLRQSLERNGLPFEVKLKQPRPELIEAMLEAERIADDPTIKGVRSIEEFVAEMNS